MFGGIDMKAKKNNNWSFCGSPCNANDRLQK